ALSKWCFIAIRKRSWEEAQDVAQKAIEQLLDPRYKAWDPKSEPRVFRHLINVARGIISNARRLRASRETATEDEKLEAALGATNDGEDEEARVASRAHARHAVRELAELTGRADGDPLEQEVMALYAEEIVELDEQARVLGRPKHDVRNARRRLQTKLA